MTIRGSEVVQGTLQKGKRVLGLGPPKNLRNGKEGAGQQGRMADPHWRTSAGAQPPYHKQGAETRRHHDSPLIGNGEWGRLQRAAERVLRERHNCYQPQLLLSCSRVQHTHTRLIGAGVGVGIVG